MTISKAVKKSMESASFIRKMFEEGNKLKQKYGVENVYDFTLGNPDLIPPENFHKKINEIISADPKGLHSYMPNPGYPFVRKKISAYLSKIHNKNVTLQNVIMTVGASGALNSTLKTILDKNDEIIIISPYFVEYKFYINNHNGQTVIIQSDSDLNPDFNELENSITKKTKGIIINSPNNPTGKVYNKNILDTIGKILTKKSNEFNSTIYLISDEPYRNIVYDNITVPSVFESYENSVIVTSFSKDLSIPGERIGYIAINPDCKYKEDLFNGAVLCNRILGFVNAPALMQRTIADLLETKVPVEIYQKRRNLFYDFLIETGLELIKPEGAFYLFPKSPINDDIKFVQHLQSYNILAVPGSGFGAPGYFRLCYCVREDVIKNSFPKFKEAINNI